MEHNENKAGTRVYSHDPSAWEGAGIDKGFRVLLRNTASMRSAWATYDLSQKPKDN